MRPAGRLEYWHRFSGSFKQTMAYSDMLSVLYTLTSHSSEGNLLSAAVGVTVMSGKLNVDIEHGSSVAGLRSFDGHALRIMLKRGL